MKKILVLTHEYYPYPGGVATYCYNLFRHFDSGEYAVATDQSDARFERPVVHWSFLYRQFRPRWLKGLLTLRQLMKSQGAQVIFTPNILPLGILAYYFRRWFGTPYVLSLHGLDIARALKHQPQRAKKILRYASHIIVNSQATGKILTDAGLDLPVSVITPYYDQERLAVDKKLEQSLRERYKNEKLILTVGRLVRRKGQDRLIAALPHIQKIVPKIRYLIIGSGPEEVNLRRLAAERKVQSKVEILTLVPDDQLGAYFSVADVFAMPTRREPDDIEGFGISYLEAAHFSLPIIAGQTGGEAEAFGGELGAIIIDKESSQELAEAVIALLDDRPLAQSLADHAHEHLLALPTWERQSKVLRSILEAL